MPDDGGAEAPRAQDAPAFSRGANPSPTVTSAAAAAKAATYSGLWAVQIGSFSARANADHLSDWCREQGFGVQVLAPPEGEQALYRVRVGPYESRDDARSAMAELALLGRSGFVSDWQE